jgi:hypothetical protein
MDADAALAEVRSPRMTPEQVAHALSRGWTLQHLATVEWLCDMVDDYGEDVVRHWFRDVLPALRSRRTMGSDYDPR